MILALRAKAFSYFCEHFFGHQMADVTFIGCCGMCPSRVDTVLLVSKLFADDVSWVTHTRFEPEMILLHSAK